MVAVWIAGGVFSVIGGLCYAELATAYPSAGGEYHFLGRAFGRRKPQLRDLSTTAGRRQVDDRGMVRAHGA